MLRPRVSGRSCSGYGLRWGLLLMSRVCSPFLTPGAAEGEGLLLF